MFEIAHLHEDALREYFELEICYTETGAFPSCLVFHQDTYCGFCVCKRTMLDYTAFD